MRRGIILAGGSATRLYPLTLTVSKQLMPVYDKPMIYYPLSALMLADIREVLIITKPEDEHAFRSLLGNGKNIGISIDYMIQKSPDGLAQAYLLAKDWLAGSPSALILGDNIFYGTGFSEVLARADRRESGATIFTYRVADPRAYGVVSYDDDGKIIELQEKPGSPRSDSAITGLYFFDGRAAEFAQTIVPSARGELEITDLLDCYLKESSLNAESLGRGFAWLDTGTHASLLDAAQYVRIIEERQGLKICCPEEIAWRRRFINDDALETIAMSLRKSGYGEYLLRQLAGGLPPALPFPERRLNRNG